MNEQNLSINANLIELPLKTRNIYIPFVISVLLLIFSNPLFALNVGEKAPSIDLPLLNHSTTLSTEHLKGKVVYVDFWASWCGPCRKSLPWLNTLHHELKDRGFEVIGVNVDDDKHDALEFLKKHPVQFPVIHDVEGKAYEQFSPIGMPTSYLIDRHGIVRAIHAGFKESDQAALKVTIEKQLNTK